MQVLLILMLSCLFFTLLGLFKGWKSWTMLLSFTVFYMIGLAFIPDDGSVAAARLLGVIILPLFAAFAALILSGIILSLQTLRTRKTLQTA